MQDIQTLLEELDQLYRLGKVQMNVTVSQLVNQSQWWLQISIGLRRRNRPLWGRIAQTPQPIVIGLRHPTTPHVTPSLNTPTPPHPLTLHRTHPLPLNPPPYPL